MHTSNVFTACFICFQYCVEFRQWKKELERARFAKVLTTPANVLHVLCTLNFLE